MFSQITSGVGVRLPTRALCALARERGAISIVDGAQAIGQIKVDVKALGCDAYVASPHKWMLAPKGTGILYITQALQPRVWNTLASGGFWERKIRVRAQGGDRGVRLSAHLYVAPKDIDHVLEVTAAMAKRS